MGANLDLIRATYEGSSEQNGQNLLAAIAPYATWTEAEGFPYAGTYTGPDAIIAGVFHRLATEWTGYKAVARTFVEDGDRVAVFGEYSGTYNVTGIAMRAPFAHLYRIRHGQIASMVQYVNILLVDRAVNPA